MGDRRGKITIRLKRQKNKFPDEVKSPLERDDEEPSSDDMDLLNRLINISSPMISGKIKDNKKKDKKKDKKKKKNKDKKKDKKKDKNKMRFDGLGLFDDEDDEEFVPGNKKKKVDKNDEAFYETRFGTSLIMLRNLLEEVNGVTNDSKKYLEQLKKGQTGSGRAVKVSPMAISSQTSNIVTLLNTKLSILKEVTDVNKNISDLELKKASADQKANAKEAAANDSSYIMDQMFSRVLSADMPETKEIEEYRSKKSKKRNISLDDRVKEMEESGDLVFTDNEKAFKYENNVEIVIEKNMDTGRWNFAAYTLDGDEIGDYPLPDKKTVGKVDFNDDKDFATDKVGNTYRVFLTKTR